MNSSKWEKSKKALITAFPHTLPVLAGYSFLGMAYGIYMNVSGFSFWYPLLTSVIVFSGSAQFLGVDLLLQPFNPLQALAMTVMTNARYLYYGISMLDRYKGYGLKKPYMVFGMSDETFSINYTALPPEGVDHRQFMFFVTLLDHIYWIFGATMGGVLGGLITFNTEGLDFVVTAMFTVIFLEQWQRDKDHTPALLGLGLSLLCLIIFGADSFIIPSMAAILAGLAILRGPMERKGEKQ